MHSLHNKNNMGHETFHGRKIVASVTSGVVVRTIPRLKVEDVFQMVGNIKIDFHNLKSAANNIKYDICLICSRKVSYNMERYMQMM